jgi:GAF domain-containing protein
MRLAAMVGVKMPEAMHGLMFPVSSQERVQGEPQDSSESYYSDTSSVPSLGGNDAQRIASVPGVAPETDLLFCNFTQREGVRSCARLRWIVDGMLQLVLWMNFDQPREFTNEDKAALSDVRAQLAKMIDEIATDLDQETTLWITKSVHILNCTSNLATFGQPRLSYIQDILRGLVRAFDLSETNEVAEVLLFDPHNNVLKPEARIGTQSGATITDVEIHRRDDPVSWVALMRRAVLVPDLSQSPFGRMKLNAPKSSGSQLAVPLLSGSEFLGVLNLKSPQPNRFPSESVRPLWYAANQTSVAYRLAQHGDRTKQLLEIANAATREMHVHPSGSANAESDNPVNVGALGQLAQLAREWLGAAECDIWHYNKLDRKFVHVGATYQEHSALPRMGGWSHYIHKCKRIVWISQIKSDTEFRPYFWNEKNWESTSPIPNPPTHLNENLMRRQVQSEIGIPLLFKGSCVGVAWVKYKIDGQTPPGPEQMQDVNGFAVQGGLFMDLFDRSYEAQELATGLKEAATSLFKDGGFSYPGFDCYIIRRPRGELGGDFHNIYPLPHESDEVPEGFQVGIFIGDAQGHGFNAALHMMPIITAFKVVHKDSESTKHTLLRLLPTCNEGGHNATALYFFLRNTGANKPLVLFASNSGHPPLFVYSAKGELTMFPSKFANRGQYGPAELNSLPLAEERMELIDGDILVAATDGVFDAGTKTGRPLDRQGVHSIVFAQTWESAKDLAEAIERAARERDEGELNDDLTIIVIKIKLDAATN